MVKILDKCLMCKKTIEIGDVSDTLCSDLCRRRWQWYIVALIKGDMKNEKKKTRH